jgi:RNA polymerase sigma-70 factor (ECF subfamily)
MDAMTARALPQPSADFADDAALARRVAECDTAAFEHLMRRHNRRLFRVARAILRSDADAEDALQDAYLAAWRAIGGFRGGSTLATWLTRIVINESYARLRKTARAPVVSLEDPHEMSDDAPGLPGQVERGSAEDGAMRAEMRRLLERHIDALPEQFRTAFMLREVEELSVEEAAEALGVPEATVRSRTFRARALLRAALAREIDMATVDAFAFAGARCDRIVAAVLDRIAQSPDRNPTEES